jgi:putative ABC transport system permease protein
MLQATFFDAFWRDLRYAVRAFGKSPGIVATAVVTLGLGIGANTAVFSVIHAVLLRPLAFRDPGALVFLAVDNPKNNPRLNDRFSLAEFELMTTGVNSFSAIGAYGAQPENLSLSSPGAEPEALKGARISANALDVLGVEPLLGRAFREDEDRRGGPDVALISAQLWSRRFGSDPAIAGKTATLDAKLVTIVGVLPPGFEFPFAGVDVWLPRPSEWSVLPPRFWNIPLLNGIARLKPGVTLEEARAEMKVFHSRYTQAHPALLMENNGAIKVEWFQDRLVENVRGMLWMLLGAVTFVMLIACANVASLLLARALARSHELAVRAALGAGRGRLIGQLLAESLVLSMAGAATGIVVAKWTLSGILAVGTLNRASGNALFLPGSGDIRLDGAVLAFTLAISLITATLVGLFPALQSSRPDLADVLRERGEGKTWSGGRTRVLSLRSLLVATQIALSVVLFIGAALLMQSIGRLRSVPPGFRPSNVLSMRLALPGNRYDTNQKRWAFFAELMRRVQPLPGVTAAGVALSLPTTITNLGTDVEVEGQPRVAPQDLPIAQVQSVTPDYFRAMGIPLLRGREFTAADDRPGAPPVVIVNESFARRFWPEYPRGLDPIGQHVGEALDRVRLEIVGIVGDVHERAMAVTPTPEFYIPSVIHPMQTAWLAVRTPGDPLRIANAVRGELRAIDRDQAVSDVRSMESLLDISMGQRRLTLALLGVFAGLALLLSLVGIYGSTAYSVTERTQEVGIRRALGAQESDIVRMVLVQSFAVALTGVVAGIAGAFALTRVLKEFLFQVSATDPGVFAAVSLLFIAIALAASLVPAIRAARVDPMTALRLG